MGLTLLTLRHDDTCSQCGATVPARSRAWWNPYAPAVVCVICEPLRRDDPVSATTTIERTPTHLAVDRRHGPEPSRGDRPTAAGSGFVGRVMKLLAEDSPATLSGSVGTDGERRLARLLDTELPDAVSLHDRKVPTARGAIDHLVIAPSGVWLVDAQRHHGEVECRLTNRFGTGERRLLVDGRHQRRLVDALGWHVAAVRAQLDKVGFGDVPVRPVVCFTSARWATVDPFDVRGVLVTWPTALVAEIARPGPLDVHFVDLLADHLCATLEPRRPGVGGP